MDEFYSIPVNSDPKHGLGLLASDSDEPFHFSSLCGDLDHEQLLALDDPRNFYIAFADAGVFGPGDPTVSRASTVVTPQSECSARTTLSAPNISPTSEFLSLHDKPTPQDIETMYSDTTHSIISGRPSRVVSTTWPSSTNGLMNMSSAATPPVRPVPHRPQSFSYQAQHDSTPPPPSAFFPSPSPNLQPQTISVHSPFLSPNMQSPMAPQISQLPSQNGFMQASLSGNPSPYYTQNHSQSLPPQQLQQQFQHQMQLQQQNLTAQRRTLPSQSPNPMSTVFPHQLPSQSGNPSNAQSFNHTNNSISTSSVNNGTGSTPSLPNTTGNSSTGYQCFSHGCGGRHFSNWGNLVRHHRERQLRSKAGAKPTCPRCGKGFTRSSARDAHVAGLKCVLGRRRRGAGGAAAAATTTAAGSATNGTATSPGSDATGSLDNGKGDFVPSARTGTQTDADMDADVESDDPRHSQLLRGHMHRQSNCLDQDLTGDESDPDHDRDHDDSNDNGSEGRDEDEDEIEVLGTRRNFESSSNYMGMIHDEHGLDHELLANTLNFDIGVGTGGMLTGPAYLTPQHLQFEH